VLGSRTNPGYIDDQGGEVENITSVESGYSAALKSKNYNLGISERLQPFYPKENSLP
jgi:hypothetical protein